MRFHNPQGYTSTIVGHRRWGWLWRVAERRIELDADAPLTLETWPHNFVQTDRIFVSDFGSIPPPITGVPGFSKTRFPKSYLFHDSACQQKGLYVASAIDGPYEFKPLGHEFVHALLRACVSAEGCSSVNAAAIHRAVSWFGPKW